MEADPGSRSSSVLDETSISHRPHVKTEDPSPTHPLTHGGGQRATTLTLTYTSGGWMVQSPPPPPPGSRPEGGGVRDRETRGGMGRGEGREGEMKEKGDQKPTVGRK